MNPILTTQIMSAEVAQRERQLEAVRRAAARCAPTRPTPRPIRWVLRSV